MNRSGLIAALVILLLSPAAAPAQSYRIYGAERFFDLQWQAGERAGRPVVSGYLVNTYGVPALRVRLLVESLDAGGQVLATTIDWVPGDVMPGTRHDFEVAVPPAAGYRVSVLSWDWKTGHS